MTNRLKQLIKKDFGKRTYLSLCTKVMSMSIEKKDEIAESLYEELYEKLRDDKPAVIMDKLNRLNSTILYIHRLNKTYGTVVFLFLLAVGFVLVSPALMWIKVAAIVALSACFLYRSFEFYRNRFCILDLQIAVVYRKVLEQIANIE